MGNSQTQPQQEESVINGNNWEALEQEQKDREKYLKDEKDKAIAERFKSLRPSSALKPPDRYDPGSYRGGKRSRQKKRRSKKTRSKK